MCDYALLILVHAGCEGEMPLGAVSQNRQTWGTLPHAFLLPRAESRGRD